MRLLDSQCSCCQAVKCCSAPYVGVYDVQSQKELMGIVVDDSDKKRRGAQDQLDDVNKKWQYTQDTCHDYKGKLEQAESTQATHVKVHTSLQLSLCTNHNMFLAAMWHAALWCSKTVGRASLNCLCYTHLQCHSNIAYQLSVRTCGQTVLSTCCTVFMFDF